MPAVSTPDSVPEEIPQQPEKQRPLAASSAPGASVAEAPALVGTAGASPTPATDTFAPDDGVFPTLDDTALDCANLTDVLGAACDTLRPLSGLGTVLSEFTKLADFGLGPVISRIEMPVPRLPDVAEMVGQSLAEGLGAHRVALAVQPHVLSLSQAAAVRSSAVNTLGLWDGLSSTRAALSVIEPQLAGVASVRRSTSWLSSMADSLRPLDGLGAFARQSHLGMAPVLAGLPSAITGLPSPGIMADRLAPSLFAVQAAARTVQEFLRLRPLLAGVIGGHVVELFAAGRSAADWAKRLAPSVLAEARYAFDAYRKGDAEPMKEFLRRCLRLWPVLEDHCQALAVAMVERAWEQEADLTDDQSVRRVLIRYARQGCDWERDHQIRGASIGYIPDGWEPRASVPGPEDLVIPRVVPWAERFETAPARYAARRLDEQEAAVTRAFTENGPMTWPTASALAEQEPSQGERARHKLNRLGKEWRRRESNRREQHS
ncbi:hypothetical protein M2155_008013 [Streptomyces sp. SAI-119]|nr:hypothetical protein [Streptomyces sp. SAI-119]